MYGCIDSLMSPLSCHYLKAFEDCKPRLLRDFVIVWIFEVSYLLPRKIVQPSIAWLRLRGASVHLCCPSWWRFCVKGGSGSRAAKVNQSLLAKSMTSQEDKWLPNVPIWSYQVKINPIYLTLLYSRWPNFNLKIILCLTWNSQFIFI